MKKFFIFICFAILVTSILSPFASNEYVTSGPIHDLIPHIAQVTQAKMALEQGEFPPKTAPWQNDGYGYAVFQFYNPIFYTITALVYKWFTPQNPYIAIKFILWCSLLLGTFFFYKLILWLVESEVIAFLSSVVYVMSPYLLINMFSRGAIPEAVAQCIIPIILYYSLKIYFSDKFNLNYFILSAISWCALSGTHIITFVYFSFFLAIFLLFHSYINKVSFKHISFVGWPYLFSILLGAFYIIPVGLFSKYMYVSYMAGMGGFQFETLLPTLLSMTPTSPMPLPGNGRMLPSVKLYMSLGLPTLFAIGGIMYIMFNDRELLNQKLKSIAVGLLIVFFMAFFAAWTPVDFWPYMPKILQIAQFTWRLLTQTMWPGSILFAFAVVAIFGKNLDLRHAIVGFLLICTATSPWIISQEIGSKHISEIIKNPDIGYGQKAYLIRPDAVNTYPDPYSTPLNETIPNCTKDGKRHICNIALSEETNIIQLPIFYYPDMLNVKVNGQNASYFSTVYYDMSLVGLTLPRGSYIIEAYFQGLPWAAWISAFAWLLALGYFIFLFVRVPFLETLLGSEQKSIQGRAEKYYE